MSAHFKQQFGFPTLYLRNADKVVRIGLALAAAGVAAFAGGVMMGGEAASQAWEGALIAWLNFIGLAQFGALFAAIVVITRARWAQPYRRVLESMSAFLPVGYLIMFGLLLGREFISVEQPAHRVWWMSFEVFTARHAIGALLVILLGRGLLGASIAPDLAKARAEGATGASGGPLASIARAVLVGGSNEPVDVLVARGQSRTTWQAPVFAIVYAIVASMVAYDWIMALEPEWVSTLFAVYYMIGSTVQSGFALGILATLFVIANSDIGRFTDKMERHDIGKLTFAFCIFWAYMWFSQVIVIWYGNLELESAYLVERMSNGWTGYSILVFLSCFVLPFFLLLSHTAKKMPKIAQLAALIILAGQFLNMYVLITPALHRDGARLPGVFTLVIYAGMFGLFLASMFSFLGSVPVLPITEGLCPEPLPDPEELPAV